MLAYLYANSNAFGLSHADKFGHGYLHGHDRPDRNAYQYTNSVPVRLLTYHDSNSDTDGDASANGGINLNHHAAANDYVDLYSDGDARRDAYTDWLRPAPSQQPGQHPSAHPRTRSWSGRRATSADTATGAERISGRREPGEPGARWHDERRGGSSDGCDSAATATAARARRDAGVVGWVWRAISAGKRNQWDTS